MSPVTPFGVIVNSIADPPGAGESMKGNTRMRRSLSAIALGSITTVVLGFAIADASSSGGAPSPRTKLTIIAPAAPGGGWDGFAREAQQALRVNGIVNATQVVNVPGAAGTIGLSQVARMEDRADVLLVTGGVMVGGTILSDSGETLDDTTPIARMADDYNALVVPADSPFETLDDFIAAWSEDPGAYPIAGGSLGSIDHLLSGMLAEETGIDPQSINYIAYPGGGEVVTSMLSSTAAVGLSGFNEFRDQIEAGTMRALGISAEQRLDGVDVPTFMEQGVDVTMSNWRGFVAPPGISDETRTEMLAIADELRQTAEWEDALARNNWVEEYLVDDEFGRYLTEETTRIDQIIQELGL